jgi:DNA-binding SARP family transcriptional activator/tetratricopeptide (TPR) repeat protein/DNA-binding XRE family transcriptional regulator
MEHIPGTLGDLVRGHRIRAGLTQSTLASRAGVSIRALRDIEQDRVGRPGTRLLQSVSEALELSTADKQHLLTAATRPGGNALRVGVLGPLTVHRGTRPVDVGPFKQRLLLGLLAIHAGQPVTVEEIVEVLWQDRPPRTHQDLIHTYVARLRDRVDARTISRTNGGYRLALPGEQLDVVRFEELTARAGRTRDDGDPDAALGLYEAGLRCWRGPVLADAGPRLTQHPRVVGLSRRRLAAALAGADLAIDRTRFELAAELLHQFVEDEPLHEGLHARLMRALAGAGQQAAALRVFDTVRARLANELGVAPGPELQAAQLRVLRQDVGSVVGAGTRPAQLPADLPDFTGRTAELDQLEALSGSPVTAVVISAVTGAPGVGKTALAVHWAQRAAHRYRDGQLYVDLRGFSADPPLRPIDGLRRMLTSCGITADAIPSDVDSAAALFRSVLATRRMLVVLDNAATADQVRPLLPGTSGCLVLVTSRDRLDGLVAMQGARRVGLDVLAPAEAVALLAKILGDRVPAQPRAAAELAELCGFLPLALRIAAAHIAASDGPIADYVADLRTGHRVARLAVDGDERSAAVQVAFDRSYGALSTVERLVFRRAALAPGVDFTAEDAAALADLPPDEAVPALAGLVRAHLVQRRGSGRYQFHDLLRLYAGARCRAEDGTGDRDAALLRLIAGQAEFAAAAARLLYPQLVPLHDDEPAPDPPPFAGNTAAVAWFDAEWANLVAAVRAAGDRPWPAVARLAYAVRGYLEHDRHLDDWLAVARVGLAVTVATGDRRGEASSRISLAIAHGCRSEFEAAREGFAAALASARENGWHRVASVALNNLGVVGEQTGQLDRAIEYYGEALEVNRRIGWTAGQGLCHANLGLVYYCRGMLEPAAEHLSQALELTTRANAVGVRAIALEHLGMSHRALGRIASALDLLTQARRQYREVGSRQGESAAIGQLAITYLEAGEVDRAHAFADEALVMARQIGNGPVEAEALNTLGGIHLARGEAGAAATRYSEGLALAGALQQGFPEVGALVGLAAAHRALGERVPALRYGWRALIRARERGYQTLERLARVELAAIRPAGGRPDRAARRGGQPDMD